MNTVEHPQLSPFICPYFRYEHLSLPKNNRDDIFLIINTPYYFSKVRGDNCYPYRFFSVYRRCGHNLYPLYWCNNKELGGEYLCGACKCNQIGTTYYFCSGCKVSYHKECVESLSLIKSLHHPKHHLQLVTLHPLALPSVNGEMISCSYCDARYGFNLAKLYYYCFTCKFSLDPVCARRPSFLDYRKRHEHNLNHFPRKADLICDVCGLVDSKSLIYVCLECDFVVHKNCIYLPFVIKTSRHDHRLSFTYSAPKISSCGVCRQEVNVNYGNYSCMKDCAYVAHSKCATRIDVWDGKELEEEPEEEYESLSSFEVIGDGIIQHFSHSHHMKFEKTTTDVMYDDKKQCQACVLPFYGGDVYKCVKCECDFVLHEACANLPRAKQHIAHRYSFILQVNDTKNCFYCRYCDRFSNGFRYVCDKWGKYISIDARCAAISEPLDLQCHPHPLFLSNELGRYRPCSMCGKELFQTLNCIQCDFFLCFYCATLPYKVRYEHDEHFLTLSYEENASLDWCQVCERALEYSTNKWHYTCNECVAAFHIRCVVGTCALYVKPGNNLLLDGHRINIVLNNGLNRRICDGCGRRCQDKLMLEACGGGGGGSGSDSDDDNDNDKDDDDQRTVACYRHWEVGPM